MPKFCLIADTQQIELIAGVAKSTTKSNGRITPDDLLKDCLRLEPPSQIIVNGKDVLQEIKEIAKNYAANQDRLLVEIINFIKQTVSSPISDKALKTAIINTNQGGFPLVMLKLIRDKLFDPYQEMDKIGRPFLTTSTPECCIYEISSQQPASLNASVTIHGLPLIIVDGGRPILVPGCFSFVIETVFFGNGNPVSGFFYPQPLQQTAKFEISFEDNSFLAECIMDEKTIAVIKKDPFLLFNYYRACHGHMGCYNSLISSFDWQLDSFPAMLLLCKMRSNQEDPNKQQELAEMVKVLIEELPAGQTLNKKQAAVVLALFEICAQNQDATEILLQAFPFRNLVVDHNQLIKLWALNSESLSDAIGKKYISEIFATTVKQFEVKSYKGIGFSTYEERVMLVNILRNPKLLEEVSDLPKYIPLLIAQGIITPSFLEKPECRYLIGPCSKIAGQIFCKYRDDYSDEVFIQQVISKEICIDTKLPHGLLAMLRLHSISCYGSEDDIERLTNDYYIKPALQAANKDPKIAEYFRNISEYKERLATNARQTIAHEA